MGDLPLEEICALAAEMGYEGLELSAAHLDMHRAAEDPAYVEEVKKTLERYGLAPAEYAGDPEAIRVWAVREMKDTAHAAKAQ